MSGSASKGHVVAVTNGTGALHLALLDLRDEFIVLSLTYVAALNAILYVSASPFFADVPTWQANEIDAVKPMTFRTIAILPGHTYGQTCGLTADYLICRRPGLCLVVKRKSLEQPSVDGELLRARAKARLMYAKAQAANRERKDHWNSRPRILKVGSGWTLDAFTCG